MPLTASSSVAGGSRSYRLFLGVTAFLCGAVVMAVELLAARFLAPLFGTSIIVWTSVIAVTLLSLSIGYVVGGRIADRRPTADVLFALLLLAGGLLALSGWLRFPVLTAAARLGFRTGSLVAAGVLFAPTLLILGAVSPFVVRLYSRGLEALGREVGMLYAVSTAGSFVGTLASGFWLIPTLGLSRLLACTAALLALLALAYFAVGRRWWSFAAVPVLVLAALLGAAPAENNRWTTDGEEWHVLTSRDGLYGQLKVCEISGVQRMLMIDGVNQGAMLVHNGQPASRYPFGVEALVRIACGAALPKRALVVGLGTGLVPNRLAELGLETEVVEIDPLVIALQREYFNPAGQRYTVHLADARQFVQTCPTGFDLIMMDAFSGDTVPGHLLTRESFAEFARHLNPGGILVLNLVTLVGRERTQALTAVLRTMDAEFAQVHPFCQYKLDGEPTVANVLILALPDGRPLDLTAADGHPYGDKEWYVKAMLANELQVDRANAQWLTDDHNPVDVLMTGSAELWRRDILASLDPELLLR